MNFQQTKYKLYSIVDEVLFSSVIIILIPRVLAILQLQYFPFLYRITYYANFQESLTGDFLIDDIILLSVAVLLLYRSLNKRIFLLAFAGSLGIIVGIFAVLPLRILLDIYAAVIACCAIAITAIPRFALTASRKKDLRWNYVLAAFFFILAIIEMLTLARWILYYIAPDRIYSNQSWLLARLEATIFHVFGTFSVYLYMLLPVSFLLFPFRRHFVKLAEKVRDILGVSTSGSTWISRQWVEKNRNALLVTILAFAIVFPSLQFLSSINPQNQSFGVDFYDYTNRIDKIRQIPNLDFFLEQTYKNNSERPLSILILACIAKISNIDTLLVVRITPVLLLPVLVFTVHRFTAFAFRNASLALFCAFFTLTSSYFVIGLYGGLLANWMAIIAMFALMYSIVKFWNRQSVRSYISIIALIVTILFVHVYTWTFILLALSLFLAWSYYISKKHRTAVFKILLIATTLAASVGVDLTRLAIGGPLAGFEVDKNLADQSVAGNFFQSRWNNLTYAIGTYLGGGLGNIVPLILALYWAIDMKWKDDKSRLIASFIFVAAPFVLFGDYLIQSRLLYIMPVNIAAGLGLYLLKDNIPKNSFMIITFFIILYQVNYVVRSIANFYLILPSPS